MITIRQAVYEDIPQIMKFIDEHWKKGHILARDRKFFEWQFVDDDEVNVFLGVDDEAGKIYGMVGVIKYSKRMNPDISGGTWKTIKSSNPVLGMELENYMLEKTQARYSCSAGLSSKASRIYQMMGMPPAVMDHYYRLADISEYRIAKIKDKIIPRVEDTGYHLESIHRVEEMKEIISEEILADCIMSKDYAYIQKRYFDHPVYQYDIWKIVNQYGNTNSILITREERVEDRKIGKIIDFYGDLCDLGKITSSLDYLIKEKKYEYMDVYSFGIPVQLYQKAGFVCCDMDSENIIPNYFHPFEQRNVTLRLMDPGIEGFRLFLGDGDQDRPC
ncbi:MAG: hypothetical protein HFG34_03595 [Eubacterium sp.]|nr:hypothetical protein [Eubacterium sp.]